MFSHPVTAHQPFITSFHSSAGLEQLRNDNDCLLTALAAAQIDNARLVEENLRLKERIENLANELFEEKRKTPSPKQEISKSFSVVVGDRTPNVAIQVATSILED